MHTKSIKTAAALLRANGVSLFRNASGEFQIRLCNSARNAPYYFTEDLDDAVATGLRMADERDAVAAKAAAAREDYNAAYNAAYAAAYAAAKAAKAADAYAAAYADAYAAANAAAYAAAYADAADAYAAAYADARDAQRRDGDEIEKRARETSRALYANAAL